METGMLAIRSLVLILSASLVLGASSALAQGNSANAPGQGAGDDDGDTATENKTAKRERHAALKAARAAALESFHENRTRILDEYHADQKAIKLSFLENKSRVQQECRALRNGTGYGYGYGEAPRDAVDHCVRDGLKPLILKAREEMRAAHDEAKDALRDARQAAMSQFQSEKAKAHARYGRPSD